ncbi:MAG: histidine kinase [Luteolibacter sp.]
MLLLALTISPLLSGILVANAELRPYEADEHTLQLWHLNEGAPPFKNAVKDGISLRSMHNGAVAGEQGFPGLGRAVSFNHHTGGIPGTPSLAGGIVTLASGLANGIEDNAPKGFRFQGEDGAFTYEAMLKFDKLPLEAPSIALDIVTMDGEANERVFSFRVEREGFLSFSPLQDSGAVGGAIASIPTDGPNAINKKDWFHVAVSYDGRAGVPGALQLYWTRLDRDRESANRIGVGTLSKNLGPKTGDFAIGNEARNHLPTNAEAEPFPGLIDEIRISSVARHPNDFLFVAPRARATNYASERPAPGSDAGSFHLRLTGIGVDGEPVSEIPPAGTPLSLRPGLHRLDFEIGAGSNFFERPVQLRCQLAGFNEHWQESVLGMSLTFEFLDAESKPISQAQFNMTGSSPGWGTGFTDSTFTQRREVLYSPEKVRYLRVTLSSGAPDTSGCLGIDDLNLIRPDQPGVSLWKNGNFEKGSSGIFPMRAPEGWVRGGAEPAIALTARREESSILSLIDGDQSMGGKWTCVQDLDAGKAGGRTLIVTWREAYNVITGNQQRATFLNVPPGQYTFRAIGMTEDKNPESSDLSAKIVVRPHLWQMGWFWPAVTGCVISLIAVAVVRERNRRNRRRLRELAFQTALERDRTRIARDMHDDLGTRITVLNVAASLASGAMDHDPDKARKQLDKMSVSARELVVAMDELVWAVDPSRDNLDELALRLTRHAEEFFEESDIRCRFDIPSSLPTRPISSDFRHNVSMAVREAMHNILKHAGPCEVTLTVRFEGETLSIDVRDNGRGFAGDSTGEGHGLGNFKGRLADIGGTCEITSSSGGGTHVSFRCPVPKDSKLYLL